VVGFVVTADKYKNDGWNILVSATDADGDDAYIYYYISGGVSTFNAEKCNECWFIDGYHLFQVNDAGNWEYLDVDVTTPTPEDTGVS
jgi:hypothetical protein